jgi:thiaminase/transcriptional activator TenA
VDGEGNFAKLLFDSPFSKKVRKAVLETEFFKKMIKNNLAPEEYGGYMVQDAAYIFEAIKAFDIAADKVQGGELPPEFALFYRCRSASYRKYSSYFTTKWKIQNPKSVIFDPEAATYVEYEMKLAQNSPEFLAIGILPCDMLWPWVATEINNQVAQNNVYRSWVDDNLPSKPGPSSTQRFVNKFFTEDDMQKSLKIFNEGMINELNFFRSACGEKPIDYSTFGEAK